MRHRSEFRMDIRTCERCRSLSKLPTESVCYGLRKSCGCVHAGRSMMCLVGDGVEDDDGSVR